MEDRQKKLLEKLELAQEDFEPSQKLTKTEELAAMAFVNSELALALLDAKGGI